MRTCVNNFLTLDIETSTTYGEDGIPNAVWLAYGICALYNIKGEKILQCNFREWAELQFFFNEICLRYSGYKIFCFVHNLSFEFDFLMKNISKPTHLLTNNTHAVISSRMENYLNIEFRCTYQLSGTSLAKLGKNLGCRKLDCDYRCIYPSDKVYPHEWRYCARDNKIVALYVIQQAKEWGKLGNMPFTKTGRVRKKFYEFYEQTEKNPTWDLMPPEDCYTALNNSFNGGIVITNPMLTNLKLKNVQSFDIRSSYPYAMISENFPRKIKKITPPNTLNYNEYWISKIRLKNIQTKYRWAWLSISKMENVSANSIWFNGKCIQCESCDRYMTNIDYEILCKTYNFEYEILEYYELTEVQPLPECFMLTIDYFGKLKDELKEDLENYEYMSETYMEKLMEYQNAKADYNSIYGMMVQKLVQEEYWIDENYLWHAKDMQYKYIEGKHLRRNFLFGVFITAYARRNIINFVLTNCPRTLVYIDTDSAKFIGNINPIDTHKLLPERFRTVKHLKKLGQFENEGVYDEFKTLGAKKYAYVKDRQIFLTVAGLPKKTYEQIQDIDDFKCGVLFDKCKLGKTYITNNAIAEVDEDLEITFLRENDMSDFYLDNDINTGGGVGLYPTSYLLDMTDYDKLYVKHEQEALKEWIRITENVYGVSVQNEIVI